jgi:hypothetical protein
MRFGMAWEESPEKDYRYVGPYAPLRFRSKDKCAESQQKVFVAEEEPGTLICGLYEATPDFYVRYQTDMFGIRPTAPSDSGYCSASPSAIFL